MTRAEQTPSKFPLVGREPSTSFDDDRPDGRLSLAATGSPPPESWT